MRAFLALCGLAAAVLVGLALGSGVNEDDKFQVDYSERLVRFYRSAGSDTSALLVERGDMHYYGGLFEVVAGASNAALGLAPDDPAYHDVRHLWNVLFGFGAMVFAALLAGRVAGWPAATVTLLLLLASPRLLGHALMNPKDVPFAAGYAASLYFLARVAAALPRPRPADLAGLAGGMAAAIAVRVTGLVLPALLALCVGVELLWREGGVRAALGQPRALASAAALVLGVTVAAVLLASLFWPFALQDPIRHPLEALAALDGSAVAIRVLHDGENVLSGRVPWHYALHWIALTVPLFTLLGVVGALASLPRLLSVWPPVPLWVALAGAGVPLVLVSLRGGAGYDGWRHLAFVYPPLVVLAAAFWLALGRVLLPGRTLRVGAGLALAVLVLEPALFVARNPRFPYVYFNPLAGGLSGAFGRFETDYWGLAVRPALEWMEAEGLLDAPAGEPLTLATSFFHPVSTWVRSHHGDRVRVIYRRVGERYGEDWDYGLFPSRFLGGAHLRSGAWPGSRAIHTVEADGVPLLAIERGGGPVFRAEQAFEAQRFDDAARALEEELRLHPDNELAWQRLCAIRLEQERSEEARAAASGALAVAPDAVPALVCRGAGALREGDLAAAVRDFGRASALRPESGRARVWLASAQAEQGDLDAALASLLRAIAAEPGLRVAYRAAAEIYERQGDTQRAREMRLRARRVGR